MTAMMVMGIGNELGGDDGIGNRVAQLLNQRLEAASDEPGILCIDAGTVPENYTSIIRRQQPQLLVLVDAAEMGLEPGAVRLVKPDRLKTLSFSTHSMPLTVLIDYVKELCGRVVLIGIEPSEKEHGQGLSVPAEQTAEQVVALLLTGRCNEIEVLE